MPDLILGDIVLPIMDGFMFHKIVKEIIFLSAIPFVSFTAKKESDLMRKCLLNGADGFMIKPFKNKELNDLVEAKIKRFKKIKEAYNPLYIGEKKYLVHEVNTALNGILGSIDGLIENRNDITKNNYNFWSFI
ncbi:response regulator [uncultured Flavobacterium sp.]|uniref:response regulator n=1 Tax=uncultured Flavobacterium sp. TaxID=165435 RepID=UPI0030EC8B98|tara:strand:- start:203 stop:601 length:399 start_codon:yes stop_codon:yes gene_type:complete